MKEWFIYITAMETVQSSRGRKCFLSKERKERNNVGKKNKNYFYKEKRGKKSTYINFTQYDIDNASNDNDKVKNIPWVSKVTLERRKNGIAVWTNDNL